MKKYLAAATGALILAAASLSYAQTPPGTDKPKAEKSTTSAKATKGGMKGKPAKKPKAAKRTKGSGGMSGGMKGKQDNWGDDWLRGWTLEKK